MQPPHRAPTPSGRLQSHIPRIRRQTHPSSRDRVGGDAMVHGTARVSENKSTAGWLTQLTKNERRVFAACIGGWALDAMNVQLYSFVIPALIAVWGLTRSQAGVLGTAALLISAAGGWVAGWFADRYGRVLTLQIAILTFAVFTFLSGLAQNYTQLF